MSWACWNSSYNIPDGTPHIPCPFHDISCKWIFGYEHIAIYVLHWNVEFYKLVTRSKCLKIPFCIFVHRNWKVQHFQVTIHDLGSTQHSPFMSAQTYYTQPTWCKIFNIVPQFIMNMLRGLSKMAWHYVAQKQHSVILHLLKYLVDKQSW